jgi:hypothetical protein
MYEYVVLIAAVLTTLAALAYIRSMFKGDTKPNRVTWLMWSVAPFVAAAASLSMGGGWAVIPVFMAGLGPFMIFVASFFSRKAYWKLAKFDYACGLISALAIVLWYLTSNAEFAIIFSILSDALAAVPTLVKAWHDPKTESVWPYLIGIFSPITSFLVAGAWSFSELAFPSYLIIMNILLLVFVIRKLSL